MENEKEKRETWEVRIERAIRRAEADELHVLISEARACMVDADKYLKLKIAGGEASTPRLKERAEAKKHVKIDDPLDGSNWRTNPFWYAWRLLNEQPDLTNNEIARRAAEKFGVGYEGMRKHVGGIRQAWLSLEENYLKTGGDGS